MRLAENLRSAELFARLCTVLGYKTDDPITGVTSFPNGFGRVEGRLSGADDQYLFTDLRMSGQQVDEYPPTEQQHQHERNGDHRHTAADQQRRNKVKKQRKQRPRYTQMPEPAEASAHGGWSLRCNRKDRKNRGSTDRRADASAILNQPFFAFSSFSEPAKPRRRYIARMTPL